MAREAPVEASEIWRRKCGTRLGREGLDESVNTRERNEKGLKRRFRDNKAIDVSNFQDRYEGRLHLFET